MNDKKPLVVSKSIRHSVEGLAEEKELVQVNVEGEKNVRKGEGVAAVVRKGRSGEGEKNVKVGQVVVRVNEEGGNKKGVRTTTEVGNSPVLTKAEEWRRKVGKKEDTNFLNIDEVGRTTRVTEEEMDQPLLLTSLASKGHLDNNKLLEYRLDHVDPDWAGSGIVVTVLMGETILSIQQRVEDAGFVNVDVISMGGDRFFLRCRSDNDIFKVFNDADDFFSMFLSDVHKWSFENLWYEHGAWLRVYGTLAHAWNTIFFKR